MQIGPVESRFQRAPLVDRVEQTRAQRAEEMKQERETREVKNAEGQVVGGRINTTA